MDFFSSSMACRTIGKKFDVLLSYYTDYNPSHFPRSRRHDDEHDCSLVYRVNGLKLIHFWLTNFRDWMTFWSKVNDFWDPEIKKWLVQLGLQLFSGWGFLTLSWYSQLKFSGNAWYRILWNLTNLSSFRRKKSKKLARTSQDYTFLFWGVITHSI